MNLPPLGAPITRIRCAVGQCGYLHSAGTTLCSEQLYEPVMSCGALDHPLDPVKFQPCMA